jgi:hypothetical protein
VKFLELKDIDLRQVYKNWKKNTHTFEAFIRSGPFVSLQTYDNFNLDLSVDIENLADIHKDLILRILKFTNKDFIICDLDFDHCIETAFVLNNVHNIKPVLSFNMLFNPYGLIGSRTNIENLIKYGLNLKIIDSAAYVLFCNYERYADFTDDVHKKKLNNQYEVCEDDLPYADTLAALGYNRVIFFTKKKVKEDIQNYIYHLRSSNIIVEINEGVK